MLFLMYLLAGTQVCFPLAGVNLDGLLALVIVTSPIIENFSQDTQAHVAQAHSLSTVLVGEPT